MSPQKVKIKVSIVLPAYNGEKYISEQIDSIISQSYKYWELNICEDRSTDSTLRIANDYAKKDRRIRVIPNKINLGLTKNIEKNLKFCSSNYVALCDQDDYWMPNKLKEQIQYLERNKDVGLVYHDLCIVNDKLSSTGMSFIEKQKGNFFSLHNVNVHDDTLFTLIKENHITGASILFRHELIKYVVPIPETVYHDYWIALVATTLSKIGYIDKQLVKYRQHSKNMIGATVRGYKFYIYSMFNKHFKTLYQKENEAQLSAMKRLFYLSASIPKEKKIIHAKILCIECLLRILNSKDLIMFIKNIIDAIIVIYRSRQYDNYFFLPYLIIYKINIFKLQIIVKNL